EDGIRDRTVTGVQTCALPISFTTANGHVVAIINLQGRVFMQQHTDCPFRTAQSLLTFVKQKTKMVFVDFHAEATSEKIGMGLFRSEERRVGKECRSRGRRCDK